MSTLARLRRIFLAAAMIFTAVASGALLWKPAPPENEIAPADVASAALLPAAAGEPADTGIIIGANIFSRARTTPEVRYDPLAPDVAGETSVYAPMPPEADTMAAEAVPRLYGTVLGPGGRVALLRLDASVAAAQPYREGDRAGGYQVLRIDEQSVVLGTPQGRIVLRLTRSEGATP